MSYYSLEDELKIFYEISGKEDGPKMILIHGLFINCDIWKEQVEYFKQEFNVLRYDLRGHGRSSKLKDGYMVRDHINDLLALLNYLNWTHDLFFIGHSLGGMIAMQFAIENPSYIKKITVADSFCFVTKDAVDGVIQDINDNTLEKYANLISERGLIPYNNATAEYVDKMIIDNMTKGDLIKATAATEGFNICEELKSMNIPTLLLVGEKDVRTPVVAAQMLNNLIPKSELVVIPEAGHLTILDHPKEFNSQALSFWKK